MEQILRIQIFMMLTHYYILLIILHILIIWWFNLNHMLIYQTVLKLILTLNVVLYNWLLPCDRFFCLNRWILGFIFFHAWTLVFQVLVKAYFFFVRTFLVITKNSKLCLFIMIKSILIILLKHLLSFEILIRSIAFICLQYSLKISFQKGVILDIFVITIFRIDNFRDRRNRRLVWDWSRK